MARDLAIEHFRFGIEHEFPVADAAGRFCDFDNTTYEEMARAIEPLPVFESDYAGLRVGDLGIKNKRWYIEGFERFGEMGEYLRTEPKGFEIRTPICHSLDQAVSTLADDVARFERIATPLGFRPLRTALNPFKSAYVPNPPLNAWETAARQSPEEISAHIHMLTHGPDLSFSHPHLAPSETVDIARKLTYYSPCIVPFSFSSPFFAGELWGGYSRRTFYRTGARPSVLVFMGAEEDLTPSIPTLTDRARIPAEAGRIEFKAFDCPRDIEMYRAWGALLVGVALDETLSGRAHVPDAGAHQHAAAHAFGDDAIHRAAHEVLAAAQAALPSEMRELLGPLEAMLEERRTPAHDMIEIYRETGDIMAAIA